MSKSIVPNVLKTLMAKYLKPPLIRMAIDLKKNPAKTLQMKKKLRCRFKSIAKLYKISVPPFLLLPPSEKSPRPNQLMSCQLNLMHLKSLTNNLTKNPSPKRATATSTVKVTMITGVTLPRKKRLANPPKVAQLEGN